MARPVRIAALAGKPNESYPYRLALALDESLNVLLLNGDPHDTISDHAAVAQRDGKRWGCLICSWLSRTIEERHCEKTLAGENLKRLAAIKALGQLLFVAFVIIGVVEGAIFFMF